jgi:hypothetical protein
MAQDSEDDRAERRLEGAKEEVVARMMEMIGDLEWMRQNGTIRNDDWLDIADVLRDLKVAIKKAVERAD